jgi:hypothetical protein
MIAQVRLEQLDPEYGCASVLSGLTGRYYELV